ncbi:MAG: hypothetical protein ACRC8Q_06045, partial [Aeromonas sp.]
KEILDYEAAGRNPVFDSAGGLVLNLFIEGEEPGVIEEEPTTPTDAQLEDDLQQAREMTDADPTDKQKQSGDYQQGELSAFGLDLAIENPKWHVRSGTSKDGNKWQISMAHDYGYIKGTKGMDGDEVDVFIGPNLQSEAAFVISQLDVDGKLDEHKVMLGFDDEEGAKQGYLSSYMAGWNGLGSIQEMTLPELKAWLPSAGSAKEVAAVPSQDGDSSQDPASTSEEEPKTGDIFKRIDEKAAEAGFTPLDHGELNIPGRTNGINAELDKYKAQQSKLKDTEREQAIAERKDDKRIAKEIINTRLDDMINQLNPANDKKKAKEIKEVLTDWGKWQPSKLIEIANKLDIEKAAKDATFLQSVIDGTVPDMLSPELADDIAAVLEHHAEDPAMEALLEGAVTAYQTAMLNATADLK